MSAVIAKEQITFNVWSSALLGKLLRKHLQRPAMKSSVTFARAPHSPAEGKMQQKLIFSFAEETSICSEMGLAGS